MGIGPSTKETSLHHFRDPLLDVVSSDEDLDLMGIIIVGTPDDNTDKLLVGTRAAVWAEAMRADGVILSSDGWGNSDVDFANTAEQMEIRGIPVTGRTTSWYSCLSVQRSPLNFFICSRKIWINSSQAW